MPILSTPETTEVIYGTENIVKRAIAAFPDIKGELIGCFDYSDPAALVTTELRWKGIVGLAERGVKLTYLTEITKDNIEYCGEMMRSGIEIRHLEGVKGNFGIADKREYLTTLVQGEAQPPTQALVSNVKSFVEQQQYFFDTLWQKATKAQDRFREIEEGIRPDFIETISDATEIQKLGIDLVKSAKEEILILFSTPDSFRRQVRSGLTLLLRDHALQNRVKVRILVHMTNEIRKILDELKISEKIEFLLEPYINRFHVLNYVILSKVRL